MTSTVSTVSTVSVVSIVFIVSTVLSVHCFCQRRLPRVVVKDTKKDIEKETWRRQGSQADSTEIVYQ